MIAKPSSTSLQNLGRVALLLTLVAVTIGGCAHVSKTTVYDDGKLVSIVVGERHHACLGSPSMRSPMTFRWISFVPPPMSQPNEWM